MNYGYEKNMEIINENKYNSVQEYLKMALDICYENDSYDIFEGLKTPGRRENSTIIKNQSYQTEIYDGNITITNADERYILYSIYHVSNDGDFIIIQYYNNEDVKFMCTTKEKDIVIIEDTLDKTDGKRYLYEDIKEIIESDEDYQYPRVLMKELEDKKCRSVNLITPHKMNSKR